MPTILGKTVSQSEYDRLTAADKKYDAAKSSGDSKAASSALKEFSSAAKSSGVSSSKKIVAIGVGKDDSGKTKVVELGSYVGESGKQQLSKLTNQYGRLEVSNLQEQKSVEGDQEVIRRSLSVTANRKTNYQNTSANNQRSTPSPVALEPPERVYAPVVSNNKGQDTLFFGNEPNIPFTINRPEVNIDSKQLFADLSSKPLSDFKVDLSVDVPTLEGLSKVKKLNVNSIDSFEQSYSSTGARDFEFRNIGTTTELFKNVKEANPEAYNIYSSSAKAKQTVQNFYDVENAKTIGITVGTFMATAGLGTVLGSSATVARLGATSVRVGNVGFTTGKAVNSLVTTGYGASVLVRGKGVVNTFSSGNSSKSQIMAGRLVGEVAGLGLGSLAAKNIVASRQAAKLSNEYSGRLVNDFYGEQASPDFFSRGSINSPNYKIVPSNGNKLSFKQLPSVQVRGRELQGVVYATRVEDFGGVVRGQSFIQPVKGPLQVVDLSKVPPNNFLATRYSSVDSSVRTASGKGGLIKINDFAGSMVNEQVIGAGSVISKPTVLNKISNVAKVPTGYQYTDFGYVTYGKAPKVASSSLLLENKPLLLNAYGQQSLAFKPRALTYQSEPFKFQVTTRYGVTNVRYDFETGVLAQSSSYSRPIVVEDILPKAVVNPSPSPSGVAASSGVKVAEKFFSPFNVDLGDYAGGSVMKSGNTVLVSDVASVETPKYDLSSPNSVRDMKNVFSDSSFNGGSTRSGSDIFVFDSVEKVSPKVNPVKNEFRSKTRSSNNFVTDNKNSLFLGVGLGSSKSSSNILGSGIDIGQLRVPSVDSAVDLSNDLSSSQTNKQQSDLTNDTTSFFSGSSSDYLAKSKIVDVPNIKKPSFDFNLNNNRKQNGLFVDLIVGKSGNKVYERYNRISLSEAIRIGKRRVKGSAAASFDIKGDFNRVVVDNSLGKDFTRSKRGFGWVQERSNRISSGGEKREISWRGGITKNKAKFDIASNLLSKGIPLKKIRGFLK